ncbi:YafY family protein [Tessaracoccus sp. OH4464_COT-324]|uniref:helix-turn-helix transcriptional regulator n=1 Tax=Tessaracoccus sp. OH4464_COT-324 TaxID=2491059 RepID=UPI001319CB05|nr:WYL domain-containing protein [Tessaracoccus sp. OH4464_COT-324]
MAKATSERVMNLLIALLTTRRYLSKQELREMVAGYRESKSFDRTFERDKAALRDLGIEIATGANDPDSGEEYGYRVFRSKAELPKVSFTRDELIALGLAGHVWQSSVVAESTMWALQRLKAAGAEPDTGRLSSLAAKIPAEEPDFATVHRALFARQEVVFHYEGARRRLHPWRLVQRRGLWLVHGFDPDRNAERSFKLVRMSEARLMGPERAYEVPSEFGDIDPEPLVSAVVAVRNWPGLTAGASPVQWSCPLPEGYVAYEVSRPYQDLIVADVCVAGPEAFVLAPEGIRQATVDRLTRIAEGAR